MITSESPFTKGSDRFSRILKASMIDEYGFNELSKEGKLKKFNFKKLMDTY